MEQIDEQSETGCCPRFDPEPWDEKEVTWQDKLFIRDRVRSFLHIPLNFGRVMVKNMGMIEEAGAFAPEMIVLSDGKSLWRTDLYITVSKEVPGANMERISGTFMTKVFEGPYKDAGKWVKLMKSYVAEKSGEAKQIYLFYTTCPKCAKAYGKNYTVVLAQV